VVAPQAALVALAGLLAVFPGCSTSGHSSAAACARARVGGKVVCLKPGVKCSARSERVYRSYGLTCKGTRLRQRSYIGPANP
jgi:hypothetical protein